MSNRPRMRPAARKFEQSVKMFTLAILPNYPLCSEYYSKISPTYKISDARAEILDKYGEEKTEYFDDYVQEALEIERMCNTIFSVGMPFFPGMTIVTENDNKRQLVSIRYEKIKGYDGMRVRMLFTNF